MRAGSFAAVPVASKSATANAPAGICETSADAYGFAGAAPPSLRA